MSRFKMLVYKFTYPPVSAAMTAVRLAGCSLHNGLANSRLLGLGSIDFAPQLRVVQAPFLRTRLVFGRTGIRAGVATFCTAGIAAAAAITGRVRLSRGPNRVFPAAATVFSVLPSVNQRENFDEQDQHQDNEDQDRVTRHPGPLFSDEEFPQRVLAFCPNSLSSIGIPTNYR